MRRRVVITGMGIWCPLGSEPEEVARRLTRRETGIDPLTLFEPGVLRTGCAAQVRDFDPRERFSARERRWLDRATLLALVVAERALQSAGWPDGAPARERMGLCVGASGAGQFQRVQYTLDGRPLEGRYAAMSHARSVLHLQGQTLAHRFGLRGPQASFCTASAGSALAVLHAFQLLQAGKTDFMLAGGAELLSVASLMAVDALGLTATGPCSAFSGPSGMTFGEGAAFVVLEPYDRAAARGARMFGELLGGAATCDAFDPLAGDPSGQGAYRALKAALQGAGVEPRQVGWIKASGTGLAAQDRAESSALERLFDSKCPPVCSLEPALGHPNGATPVVGLVAALASRGAGFIPPTLNEGAPRPGCGLDYVADGPRPTTGEYLVANTIAFGGLNTALVVGDVRERPAAPAPPTDVSLTGVGLVSPVGVGLEAFAAALRAGHSGVQEVTRFEPGRGRVRRAALVPLDAQPRGGRRPVDRVKHYAARAVGAALESAGLVPGERVGLVVACSRPPVGAQERFFTALPGNERGVAGAGRAVLEMGSFSVLSELSARFKLQGLGAVLTEGVSSGLHALAH
ncbi:MAG TPA: beta-ketoacyl-[acyl-carrier-protein] synthase family protein, partial [Longimicrobium sp.]|nr:beta-ketoacyl-[acyl-carrier-protein] synthase family protein [Longimicrobium sp.]